MFAVIRTGGKQYKVAPNDVIFVEKLAAEAGASIELDDVLMVGSETGTASAASQLAGAKVTATVLEQKRGEKIIIFTEHRDTLNYLCECLARWGYTSRASRRARARRRCATCRSRSANHS